MNRMKRRIVHTSVVAIALSLVFAGCQQPQSDPHASPSISKTQHPSFTVEGSAQAAIPSGAVADPALIDTRAEDQPDEAVPAKDRSSVVVPYYGEKDQAAVAASDVVAPAEKPKKTQNGTNNNTNKKEEKAAFDPSNPSLLGLHVNDSIQKLLDRFDEPAKEYTLDDEDDPMTVYDYETFTVGFTKSQKLEFVTIQSDKVDPGLNGIRLGSTAAEVTKALGEPDTNTTYVISYKSKNAILKIDVDPKTEKIQSIKLFANR